MSSSQAAPQLLELPIDDERIPTAVYGLLHVLRPRLTPEAFGELLREGAPQGLKVLTAWDGPGRCVGAALYRVLATSRGQVLFVDDLVTAASVRSNGVGAALFAALEHRGRAAHCQRVELDSGLANQAAHRFYYRQRMEASAMHFAKSLETQ